MIVLYIKMTARVSSYSWYTVIVPALTFNRFKLKIISHCHGTKKILFVKSRFCEREVKVKVKCILAAK